MAVHYALIFEIRSEEGLQTLNEIEIRVIQDEQKFLQNVRREGSFTFNKFGRIKVVRITGKENEMRYAEKLGYIPWQFLKKEFPNTLEALMSD